MFEHSPSGKGMVYGLNGKGIMASMEYTLIIFQVWLSSWQKIKKDAL